MTIHIPKAEPMFQLRVDCGPAVRIGAVRGGSALMIPILGGTVTGERLSGEVMPGGADWAIIDEQGVCIVDARYAIKAKDGTIIQVFNGGANPISRGPDRVPSVMLTMPRFVAPDGDHAWLNQGVYVGTLTPDSSGRPSPVHVGVFRMA